MNKTKWSKLRSPHGAYKPFRCGQGSNTYSQKRPLLDCCGEEPVFPGRMQGHSVVKVLTDRWSGDKHTEVIHCYRWNGLLSQIIDDKHLTRRNRETKPGEAKGEKSKGKKNRERDRQKLLISRPGWVKDKELEIRAIMKFTVQAHRQLLY